MIRRSAFSCFLVLLLAACATGPRKEPAGAVARFVLEHVRTGSLQVELPVSGVRIAVSPKPVITEFDIVNVEVTQVEAGRCLLFQLTPWAARDMYRLTGQHVGERLVLVIDGVALGARRIERPIEDGVVLVFAEVPDEELPVLAEKLRSTAARLQRAARKT